MMELSSGELNANFNAAGQPATAGATSLSRAYGQDLKLGAIIPFIPGRFIANYPKPKELRQGLVCGLWRNCDGDIDKIEILRFTTSHANKFLRSDLYLNTPVLMAEFGRDKQSALVVDEMMIADNIRRNFPRSDRAHCNIKDDFWPDILVRRAYALIHMEKRGSYVQGQAHGLIREGFFFSEMRPENLRSRIFAPDVPRANGAVIPAATPLIPQRTVDEIARFSVSYYWHFLQKESQRAATFPTYRERPKDWYPVDFPVWEKPKAAPSLNRS